MEQLIQLPITAQTSVRTEQLFENIKKTKKLLITKVYLALVSDLMGLKVNSFCCWPVVGVVLTVSADILKPKYCCCYMKSSFFSDMKNYCYFFSFLCENNFDK